MNGKIERKNDRKNVKEREQGRINGRMSRVLLGRRQRCENHPENAKESKCRSNEHADGPTDQPADRQTGV